MVVCSIFTFGVKNGKGDTHVNYAGNEGRIEAF